MRAVIVGGGVIGLTTAYHLAREGAEVVVLDARATGLGASAVNAGWFVPAEAMPVPGPKVVVQTLKWMLRPDSPVYIRPSLDPRFAAFMLRMWRHCNDRDQRAGFEAQLRLAQSTAEVFDEYRTDGMDYEMHAAGLLMAFTQQDNLDHHVHNLDLVRAHDLDPQVLVGDAVRAHEPMLSDEVIGGVFFPHERHLAPRSLVESLHQRLVELGVRVVEGAPVRLVPGEPVLAARVAAARTARIPALCAVLLLPVTRGADVGMIVLEQGGFTPMSGGNTIAARATIEDARVVAVTVVNVPAFVVALEGPAPG